MMTGRKPSLAVLSHYPASAVLDEVDIKPKYRANEHPATWVDVLYREMAGAFAEWEIHIVSDSRAVYRSHTVERDGLTFHFIRRPEPIRADPYCGYVPASLRMRRKLTALNPSLVVGYGMEHGYGLMACRSGIRCVFSIQGIQEYLAPYKSQSAVKSMRAIALEQAAVRRADAVWAENTFAFDWAARHTDRSRIHVMPHAVAGEFLALEPAVPRPRLVCVGSLSRTKGTDIVLDAFLRIADMRNAELVMIGDGPMRADAESAAARSGGRIMVAGRATRPEIIEWMRPAAGAVLGSRMDTSPNAVTEAHAAGLPVIGTRAGGLPEMIRHGIDGWLVESDDAKAMSNRMRELLSNVEAAREMGAAGRDRIRRIHAPAVVARRHMDWIVEFIQTREATL